MSKNDKESSYQSVFFRQEVQREAERLGLGAVSQSFLQSTGAGWHIGGVIWSALLLLLFASLFLALGIVPIILFSLPPFSLDVGRVFGEVLVLLISGSMIWLAFSSLRKEIAAIKYHDREQLHLYREGLVYL